ncbi:hypothetical protein ACFB49_09800 [Sphingomonas sp. DBB INV C78]|uniref:PAS domain-containing protein n=1 Tax=Sphingomonas sp. DBB INV C78 TaxID=3349434 RepID=UPI0036D2655D
MSSIAPSENWTQAPDSKRLLETLSVAVYVTDEQGRLTGYNGAAVRLWGRAPSLFIRDWWTSWRLFRLDGTDLPFELCPMALAIREGRSIRGEEAIMERADGSRVPFLAFVELFHQSDGTVGGAVNTLVDLTEARQSALALRERDEHYRHVVDLNPQLLWVSDARGSVIDVGGRWLAATGLDRSQALGDGWLSICHPDDVPRISEVRQRAFAAGKPFDAEYRVRTAKGEYHWVHSRAFPRRDSHGAIICWYGTTEDIDTRVRAELKRNQLAIEIRHATRVNAMGQIAGMLAHELSQPLAAAANYVDGCERLVSAGAKAASDNIFQGLHQARRQIDHAADIVSRLRLFMRNQAPKEQPTRLNQAVADAVQLATVGNANRMGISLALDLDPRDPVVCVDAVEIQQVVFNLVRNAIEAMEDQPMRHLHVATLMQQDAAQIMIRDTGPGSAMGLDEMFEPFLTTKPTGLGLGLAICRRIVERYRGRIWAEANGDRGITMRASLPLVDAE